MTRIGRQVPHFEEVDLNSIKAVFSDDKKYRYVLEMQFRESLLRTNACDKVAVILKNPSSADEHKSDATIRKVETYVYHHFKRAGTLYILNLFAIRATDASDVQKSLVLNDADFIIGSENNKYFNKVLAEASEIICAWGGNSGIDKKIYHRRIDEVKTILGKLVNKNCYEVVSPKGSLQPLHGLMWGYDYKCIPFVLNDKI
jgi:hypothetical protein